MTDTPVQAAAPPRESRNAAVIAIATAVGMAPRNRPDTASSTERVSNTIPGSNPSGASMIAMPMQPRIAPASACRSGLPPIGQRLVARS